MQYIAALLLPVVASALPNIGAGGPQSPPTYGDTSTPAYQTSTPSYETTTPSYYTTSSPPGYPTSTPYYQTSSGYYPTSTPQYPTSTPYYPTSTPQYPTSTPQYPTTYPAGNLSTTYPTPQSTVVVQTVTGDNGVGTQTTVLVVSPTEGAPAPAAPPASGETPQTGGAATQQVGMAAFALVGGVLAFLL